MSRRDTLLRELHIQDNDIKLYDDAINNIEIQKKFVFQIEKEIEKIKNTITIVQQGEQFLDCTDETRQAIMMLIDDIIMKANESWNIQKLNIISQLELHKAESNKSYEIQYQ